MPCCEIYVLRRSACVLSRKASSSLGLVKFTVADVSSESEVEAEYPRLFTGLGKLSTEYDIKIDPNAKPFSFHVPRRIPLPHMSKVKKELERLCELDVIIPVSEPTEWSAPIVVVPKSNNQVHMCVDLKQLNRAVLRERHMLRQNYAEQSQQNHCC